MLTGYIINIEGTIPSELGQLSYLLSLYVNSNSIEGIVFVLIVLCRLLFNLLQYRSLGTVPSSLCEIASLTKLYITKDSTNPLVTCAPLCLTSVTTKYLPSAICPSSQESAICSFIAATDIESISTHTMWSCTTDGITSTDPCSPAWSGVTCSGGSIVSLDLNSVGVAGIFS